MNLKVNSPDVENTSMGSAARTIRISTKSSQSYGSVIVELAIIVPLILLVVGGTVQFGLGLRDALRLTALASSLSKQVAAIPLNPTLDANAQLGSICDTLGNAELSLLNASDQNPAEHILEITFFKVTSLNRIFSRITISRPFGGLTRTLGFQNLINRRGEAIAMLTSGANLGLENMSCP